VRQGQIGEIISAKPQARRLILEEAAGVSGLHSRRHEAELRLKGAEDNLARLEDVLQQIDAQIESLKRQARQSSRYKNLAFDIRRNEALALHISWREHEGKFVEAQRRTYEDLYITAALKAMLPWLTSHVEETRALMGGDFWAYGFESNRASLATFLRYNHEQGLSKRLLEPEELFAPETMQSFKI